MASDAIAFIKEVTKKFEEIGSIVPSSPYLGKAMVKPIKRANGPLNILEAGPGTGPITKEILKVMSEEDTLVVCEINEPFMHRLQMRLNENPLFHKHKARIKFHLGPVQELRELNPEGHFDVIVSSLPFTNFTKDLVSDILDVYLYLLNAEGKLSFVEYVGLRKIGSLIRSKEQRERLKAVEGFIADWQAELVRTGRIKKGFTLLNVPPAMTVEVSNWR
jgi:phosphatidylethanolamine/phosphatidyl-N-methylethanolamine N-methyltransferase